MRGSEYFQIMKLPAVRRTQPNNIGQNFFNNPSQIATMITWQITRTRTVYLSCDEAGEMPVDPTANHHHGDHRGHVTLHTHGHIFLLFMYSLIKPVQFRFNLQL